jgi:hypothetical protein
MTVARTYRQSHAYLNPPAILPFARIVRAKDTNRSLADVHPPQIARSYQMRIRQGKAFYLAASELSPVSHFPVKETSQISSGFEAGRTHMYRSPRTIPAGCLIQPKHGTYLFKERRG